MLVLTLILVLKSEILKGQETDSLKCNISVVLTTYEKLDSLNEDLILDFLKTFGEECKNNVEYSQFSNETLFLAIQKSTEQFCKTLEKNAKTLELNKILFELEYPIHDLIDLHSTKEKIEKLNITDIIKTQLINSIDLAIKNSN